MALRAPAGDIDSQFALLRIDGEDTVFYLLHMIVEEMILCDIEMLIPCESPCLGS